MARKEMFFLSRAQEIWATADCHSVGYALLPGLAHKTPKETTTFRPSNQDMDHTGKHSPSFKALPSPGAPGTVFSVLS